MKKQKGFSLTELVVVMFIVIILASIAVPTYIRAFERSKGAKAHENLHLIRNAELERFTSSQGFTATFTDLQAFVPEIATNDGEWTYTVPDVTASTFTARAVRNAGIYQGFRIEIIQSGSIAYLTSSGGVRDQYPP